MDIAALGFSIDSSQAATAGERLEKLGTAAGSAARQGQQFTLSARDLQTALTSLANQVQQNNAAFQQTSSMLDAMLSKLDQTRAKINDSTSAFQEFSKVQAQVDALGRTFGVTSVALEQYEAAARKLNMSADQTATSLQRITSALENQTSVGRQIRQTMLEYGVSLQGLGVADAAKVLEQFTDKMRGFQDTAGRYRGVQSVLGPVTPDVYARMETPAYEPMFARAERERALSFSQRTAEVSREAAVRGQQNATAAARFEDLSGSYNSSSLSQAERARITREMTGNPDLRMIGPGMRNYSVATNPSGSQESETGIMEWLAKNPNDPAARGARTWGKMGSDLLNATGIPAMNSYYASGGYGADQALRGQQFTEDQRTAPGWWSRNITARNQRFVGSIADAFTGINVPDMPTEGWFGRRANDLRAVGRGAQELVGFQPGRLNDRTRDARPRTADEEQNDLLGDAQAIGSNGDSLPGMRAQLGSRAISMTGAAGNDLRDRYRRTYGDTQGDQRFNAARYETEQMIPALRQVGGREMVPLLGQQWSASQPYQQRGESAALAAFGRTQGISNPEWLWQTSVPGGTSAAQMLSGRLGGPGTLNPEQIEAFRRQQATSLVTTELEERGQTRQSRIDQNAIRGAIGSGTGAVAEETAEISARNAALATSKSIEEASIRGYEARLRLIDATTTAMARETQATREQNDAAERKQKAIEAAGFDPVARATAAGNADIAEAQLQAQRRAGGATYTDPGADMRRAAGISAASQGGAIVASTQQELALQQRMLSVAGERLGVQEKMTRAIEVEKSFEQAMGEARRAGPDRVAEIQRQIDETKRLREEIASVNREAGLFKLGADANQSADWKRYLLTMPPEQRREAEMNRPAWEAQRNYGPDGAAGAPPGATPRSGPGFSSPTPEQMAQPMANITSPAGANFTVAAAYAQKFDQLLRELHEAGYPVTSGGGLNVRNIAGTNQPSWHGAGMALDANPAENPRAPNLVTNLPPQTAEIAARLGIGWGGNWRTNPDPMHFSFGPNEGSTGAAALAAGNSRDLAATQDTSIQQRAEAARQSEIAEQNLIRARQSGNQVTIRAAEAAAELARRQVEMGRLDPGQQAAVTRTFNSEANTALLARLSPQFSQAQEAIARSRLAGAAYASGGLTEGAFASQSAGLRVELDQAQQLRANPQLRAEEAKQVDLLIAKIKELLGLRRQEFDAARSTATQQELATNKNSMELMQADINAGGLSWGLGRDRIMTEARITQRIAQNPQDNANGLNEQYAAQQRQMLAMKAQLEDVNAMRTAFQGFGDAAASAFSAATTGGQKFGTVMATLTQNLAQIAAKQFIFRPIMSMFGSMFDGLLGGGGGGSANISSSISANGSAMGNVFADRSIVPFANGGVIDRPTFFPMANGGTGLAGEAGAEEGILPLKRLPNGNLGVMAAGAGNQGGGHTFTMNAPITIQGGAAGEGGMKPEALAQLQRQMREATEGMFNVMVDKAMRPGGRLANV